jgi:hypothetical protein
MRIQVLPLAYRGGRRARQCTCMMEAAHTVNTDIATHQGLPIACPTVHAHACVRQMGSQTASFARTDPPAAARWPGRAGNTRRRRLVYTAAAHRRSCGHYASATAAAHTAPRRPVAPCTRPALVGPWRCPAVYPPTPLDAPERDSTSRCVPCPLEAPWVGPAYAPFAARYRRTVPSLRARATSTPSGLHATCRQAGASRAPGTGHDAATSLQGPVVPAMRTCASSSCNTSSWRAGGSSAHVHAGARAATACTWSGGSSGCHASAAASAGAATAGARAEPTLHHPAPCWSDTCRCSSANAAATVDARSDKRRSRRHKTGGGEP